MTPAEKVALLLTTRLEYLPSPRTATGSLRSLPGPSASRWVPCETCGSVGRLKGIAPCVVCRDLAGAKIRRQHGCHACPSCEGRGERRRRKGDEDYDAYSGKPLLESRQELEELERDHGSRRRRPITAIMTAAPELGWIVERDRWRAHGSYDDLERQLEWLRARFPGRYEQVLRWAVTQHDPTFTWEGVALLEVKGTVELLAHRMPEPIRVPAWIVERAA